MASDITAITNEHIGQTVTFTSKASDRDSTIWQGVVQGVVTYTVAKKMRDLLTYNAMVKKVDPSVGSIETLTYFIITLSNDSGDQQEMVFANEWVSEGSISLVQEKVRVQIEVYDAPDADHSLIVSELLTLGYRAVIKGVL